jgi:hypothetical protein
MRLPCIDSFLFARTLLLPAFIATAGCASGVAVPGGGHRIASQVPAGSVVVPSGVQDVYVQRHGLITMSTLHLHAKAPSTQPEPLPLLFLFMVGPNDKVDVYVPNR